MIDCIDYMDKPEGHFHLDIYQYGKLIGQMDGPNLVVMGYQPILANLLAGGADAAGFALGQIGFGSGAVAPTFGQTTLADNAFVKPLGAATITNNATATAAATKTSVAFAFTLGADEGNGVGYISEFGLLAQNGTLFARKVRAAPLQKDDSISLSGSWVLTFTK